MVQYWLSYNNGAEKLRLPVNPNGIQVKSPFGFTDLDVTHLGQYSVFGERGLAEFTLSSFFPISYNPSYCEYEGFPHPSEAIKTIEGWRDKKRPIRLIVTGSRVNYAVTIRDFDMEFQKAGEMGDVYYTLTLKEYRFQADRKEKSFVEIEEEKASTKSEKKAETRPGVLNKPVADGAKTYTVKAGDSLSKVFGKTWRKVYDANKKLIGANPSILKPGQKLVIPK